jgi:hypothetical protein
LDEKKRKKLTKVIKKQLDGLLTRIEEEEDVYSASAGS